MAGRVKSALGDHSLETASTPWTRFREPVQWDSRPADFGPPSKQPNVASVRQDRAVEYRLASDRYRDSYQRGNPRTIRPEANAVGSATQTKHYGSNLGVHATLQLRTRG